MKWSKHRKQLIEFLCPELQKRIDFHVTSYRRAHDQVGEAWITIDGEKVIGASNLRWWKAFSETLDETNESSTHSGLLAVQKGYVLETYVPITEQKVIDQEVYETGYFLDSLREYLLISLDEALESKNHFIRAFAMVDRRLRKRRFEKIVISDADPTIVRLFYSLRANAKSPRAALSSP